MKRWTKEDLQFLNNHYKNMSYKEIAKELSRTEKAIRNKVYELGKSKSIKKIDITKEQKEVIEGCLLGDGYLFIQKKGKNSIFIYETVKKSHIEFIKKILDDVGLEYKIRKNKNRLATPISPDLTKMYKKWYEDGKKSRIPKDFELTPLKVLLWYIGDGHFYKKICVITCPSFERDIDRINKQFKEEIGFKLRKHYSDGKLKALATTVDTTKDFLEYIETEYGYPKCYDYKFPEW